MRGPQLRPAAPEDAADTTAGAALRPATARPPPACWPDARHRSCRPRKRDPRTGASSDLPRAASRPGPSSHRRATARLVDAAAGRAGRSAIRSILIPRIFRPARPIVEHCNCRPLHALAPEIHHRRLRPRCRNPRTGASPGVSSTNGSASVLATRSSAAEASCYTPSKGLEMLTTPLCAGRLFPHVSGDFPPARFLNHYGTVFAPLFSISCGHGRYGSVGAPSYPKAA